MMLLWEYCHKGNASWPSTVCVHRYAPTERRTKTLQRHR
jgi:hypothetical protein